MKHYPLILITLALLGLTASAAQPKPDGPVDEADSFILSSGDKLVFSVAEDPSPSSNGVLPPILVSAVGELTCPVSRSAPDVSITIRAKGKTLGEIRKELKEKLEADYYKKATVTLNLSEQTRRSGLIYFTGEVKSATLPLAAGDTKSLYEALVLVGTGEFANLRKVSVHRINPLTKKREVLGPYNVEEIRTKNKGENDIELRDGDRVDVPAKKFNF